MEEEKNGKENKTTIYEESEEESDDEEVQVPAFFHEVTQNPEGTYYEEQATCEGLEGSDQYPPGDEMDYISECFSGEHY